MIQEQFADRAAVIAAEDPFIIGLAAGGSWINKEMDDFSDLDLVLVTREAVTAPAMMMDYAARFGLLLNAFTGEHVGEPALLICLYDDPLLHVDIKFLTIEEFYPRIEDPQILFDRENLLRTVLENSKAGFPYPDYQWIEDRFWTWIHYGSLKIGRGEYFEAMDFLAYLRMVVLGPLLHILEGNLPRGVRKVEVMLSEKSLEQLKGTIASDDRNSLVPAYTHAITAYKMLRAELYPPYIIWRSHTEEKVLAFFETLVHQ
jgi:hypothetical protein